MKTHFYISGSNQIFQEEYGTMKKTPIILLIAIIATAIALSPANAAAKAIGVKVLADSENYGYEAWKAMDGDPETMWHTSFGSITPSYPHHIIFDLGKSYEISGFTYLPRTAGGSNGTISDYELYITDNPNKYGKPIIKSKFTKANGENIVKLDNKTRGRFVKLLAATEVNGNPWSSIAEMQILVEGVKFTAADSSEMIIKTPRTESEMQYETLRNDWHRRSRIAGYADQTFNSEALISDSDRNPVDIVLRRSTVLLDDIKTMPGAPDMTGLNNQLKQLKAASQKIAVEDFDARFELFEKALKLRRKIAFSNPLLDFDKILFMTRHRSGFNHMCDQYYGINAKPGGSLHVLSDPFSDNPKVRDVLADSIVERGRLKGQKLLSGSFVSPDLSWDGKTIAFGYVECRGDTDHRFHTDPSRGHWNEGQSYHVFKVNVDGSGLEQLTDGTWNDFDPCWMPSGRMAFISERRGGYLRCGRVCPTYTLYDMNADGSDIRCLSPHETNEWHPSVTNEGMIIYTRWDYVDRHGCTAHHPWMTTPDGRDSRAVHGNFSPRELRADMELDVRAIPGSHKFIATGAPHHGQAFGSLVIFDPRIEDDDVMSPVKRVTPEVDFPETQGGAQVYGNAWPLSDKYYLCVYDAGMKPGAGNQGGKDIRGDYGIYLLDAFGNKELIYRNPEIACQNPVPLRPRLKPSVIPEASERIAEGVEAEATMAVVDVYDSRYGWPEGTKINKLRIYQIIPMSVPSGEPPHETSLREPTAGDSVVLARYVLGTVPVEEDGSAYFKVPAKKELFFQTLDENGLAIQSMRSATYAQPGEKLVCQGCHEPRQRVAVSATNIPLAMRREPSVPEPDVDGTNPFSYPRLVQPVLEKNCLGCHQKNKDKAPRLDRELVVKGRQKWFASYHSLAPEYAFWKYGDRHRTIVGKFGARASKLYNMLQKGHHDVKLSTEDMHRITVWLDSCSVFYGVYEKEGGEAQLRGEIVYPTLE